MTKGLPYVKRDMGRDGKMRLYFRFKGIPLTRLPDDETSAAFKIAYAECIALKEQHQRSSTKKRETSRGRTTIRNLVDLYYTRSEFHTLAKSTKRDYRSTLEAFCKDHGHRYVDDVTAPKLDIIISNLWKTPGKANKLIKRLRALMKLAVRVGIITDNPALCLDFFPTGEIHTW